MCLCLCMECGGLVGGFLGGFNCGILWDEAAGF